MNDDLDQVNALICTSVKLSREPKGHEIILNGADGLDWKTAVGCDLIHLLPKAKFLDKRGVVAAPRRVAIARKIAEVLRLRMS